MSSILKKHRFFILLLGGLALASVAVGWMWHVHNGRDLRDQVSRIRRGMTKQQVHAIIGSPPGDYRSTCPLSGGGRCTQGAPAEEWHFDDGDIKVTYGGGIAEPRKCFEVFWRQPAAAWRPASPSLIDRIMSQLGL
jgi:hypothetical protein